MTERFKKAYDALTRAYFEGTLAKGTCTACACGNIILNAVGIPLTKKDLQLEIDRYDTHCVITIEQDIAIATLRSMVNGLWGAKRDFYGEDRIFAKEWAKDYVNEAGYTTAEFVEIEKAFEKNTKIMITHYHFSNEQQILEDQYNGLCAVVDVLLDLDGDTISPKGELKQEFRKHPKLATV